MNQTMENLRRMEERDHSTLIRTLFGRESPSPISGDPSEYLDSIQFIDPTLNDSQKNAVKFALASKEIALIHGPPGVSSTQITSPNG